MFFDSNKQQMPEFIVPTQITPSTTDKICHNLT